MRITMAALIALLAAVPAQAQDVDPDGLIQACSTRGCALELWKAEQRQEPSARRQQLEEFFQRERPRRQYKDR
jgi:hypothetical protein